MLMDGIGLSRRDMFRPLLSTKYEYDRTMPSLPKTPAPGQPVAANGWKAIADVVERIKESLPKESSGNADVDFALVAAPVIEALVDLASERSAGSNDKAVLALCKRISGTYISDLQSLIDFLQNQGHGEK
jgi:hypothetical protein